MNGVEVENDDCVGVPLVIVDELDEPEHSGALRLGETMPGTRLRVLERINDGAAGVVFRGEHVELGRQLAIKVLRRVARYSEDRDRFLGEARVATAIDSPFVVDVVDFGQLPDGRLWYAMELLDGEPLSNLLARERRLPLARGLTLLRMACKGLAAAHAHGVVHCDVKPQNLLVVPSGDRERLVIVDFGIAHEIGVRPGTICGTPEYISPEQIDKAELDPRTDIYALGCCAYEMLTGQLLIEDDCSVQRAVVRHMDGVEHGLVFPPEAELPASVQALVRRCLARDPGRRPASMAELEAELCELQIACGVPPTRDDLALPDVDRVRREKIAMGFANMLSPPRRAWVDFGVLSTAVSAVAVAALAIFVLGNDPAARAIEDDPVGRLADIPSVPRESKFDEAPIVIPTAPGPAELAAGATLLLQEADPPRPVRAVRTHREGDVVAPTTRAEQRHAKRIAAREVRRHPASARAHLHLAEALRGLGRKHAAARQYRVAARLGSRTAAIRLDRV
jgi:predicted Ser/Thr protein kinase